MARDDADPPSAARYLAARDTAAGTFGPRGCDPLAWQRPFRIQRAQYDWRWIRQTLTTITGTPSKVCGRDPGRALLTIQWQITLTSTAWGQVMLGTLQAMPTATKAVLSYSAVNPTVYTGSPPTLEYCGSEILTYQRDGALVTEEWWAQTAGTLSSATVCFTEWGYDG
jgi:hypothetical protein